MKSIAVIVLSALLLFSSLSFAERQGSIYESKPIIIKKWENLSVHDMEQLGNDLYVYVWKTLHKPILKKIDLHRILAWKTIVYGIYLNPYIDSLFKYRNKIYYVTEGPAVYRIEGDDKIVKENIYYPKGASIWRSVEEGIIFLKYTKINYTTYNVTSWFGSYNLLNHTEKSFNMTNPPSFIWLFGDEDNIYFVNIVKSIDGNMVITNKTLVYGYRGHLRWNTTMIHYICGSDNKFVYALLWDGSFGVINKYTGKIVWKLPYSIEFTSKIPLYDDTIYVVGAGYKPLWKISKKDGKIIWTQNITVGTRIIRFKNYVIAYNKTCLYFLNDSDGKILWKIDREDLHMNKKGWGIVRVTADGDRICVYMGKRDYPDNALFVLGWPNEQNVIIIVSSVTLIIAVAGIVSWKKHRGERCAQ